MPCPELREQLEELHREEYGRILATLLRYSRGDFEAAEAALSDAFAAALRMWPERGVPDRPGGWLSSVARRRLLDAARRGSRTEALSPELEAFVPSEDVNSPEPEDERLRLLFLCCHPALSHEAQVALTLNAACGLQASEIARGFLVPEATMAQRIVRAKAKIRGAAIPYELPSASKLGERLAAVVEVVYLIFNEGHTATAGANLQRRDLVQDALHLGGLLVRLQPREPEVLGLFALMTLHDARREARLDAEGIPLTLEDQDRSLWDSGKIERGTRMLERALQEGRPGPLQVQAAIAALHAEASNWKATDWPQIALLYERLEVWRPDPVVRLNRAVAIGMCEGPERGLEELERVAAGGSLDRYPYLHAVRAAWQSELGMLGEARRSYASAIVLCENDAERKFLERRAESLTSQE